MYRLCSMLRRPYVWFAVMAIVSIGCLIYLLYPHFYSTRKEAAKPSSFPLLSNKSDWEITFGLHKVNANYGRQIETYAKQLNLPADYFKALILLECSGNYPPGNRYEPHVFDYLKAVQKGELFIYNGIRREHLAGCNNRMLQQMATSWGPLQIMGYHAIHLGIRIDELKGERGLYFGMLWAKQNYGHFLKRGLYGDAFHFHNTGKPYPKQGMPLTRDPYYVGNGIKYVQKLREKRRMIF